MALYVQFSGWNPNFVVHGYPGNDSSLTILHQATSSFPVPANTRTDVGPISSTGLTTFIRLDGVLSLPVPTDFNIRLYTATSLAALLIAEIDKDVQALRIISPNFFLPQAFMAVDETTGNFFIYFGIQTSLISGTTLQIESDFNLDINRYIVYSSTRAPSVFALKPGDPKIPTIPSPVC